jgi:hypothetical protein
MWQIDGLKLLFLLTSIVGYFVYSVQPKSPFKMVYQQVNAVGNDG